MWGPSTMTRHLRTPISKHVLRNSPSDFHFLLPPFDHDESFFAFFMHIPSARVPISEDTSPQHLSRRYKRDSTQWGHHCPYTYESDRVPITLETRYFSYLRTSPHNIYLAVLREILPGGDNRPYTDESVSFSLAMT